MKTESDHYPHIECNVRDCLENITGGGEGGETFEGSAHISKLVGRGHPHFANLPRGAPKFIQIVIIKKCNNSNKGTKQK